MDRYAPGVVPGVDISSLNLHAVRETAQRRVPRPAGRQRRPGGDGAAQRPGAAVSRCPTARGAARSRSRPNSPNRPGDDAVEWVHYDPNWRQFLGVHPGAVRDRARRRRCRDDVTDGINDGAAAMRRRRARRPDPALVHQPEPDARLAAGPRRRDRPATSSCAPRRTHDWRCRWSGCCATATSTSTTRPPTTASTCWRSGCGRCTRRPTVSPTPRRRCSRQIGDADLDAVPPDGSARRAGPTSAPTASTRPQYVSLSGLLYSVVRRAGRRRAAVAAHRRHRPRPRPLLPAGARARRTQRSRRTSAPPVDRRAAPRPALRRLGGREPAAPRPRRRLGAAAAATRRHSTSTCRSAPTSPSRRDHDGVRRDGAARDRLGRRRARRRPRVRGAGGGTGRDGRLAARRQRAVHRRRTARSGVGRRGVEFAPTAPRNVDHPVQGDRARTSRGRAIGSRSASPSPTGDERRRGSDPPTSGRSPAAQTRPRRLQRARREADREVAGTRRHRNERALDARAAGRPRPRVGRRRRRRSSRACDQAPEERRLTERAP